MSCPGKRGSTDTCRKLSDANPYIEKLAAILTESSVKRLTVVHMEVQCCTALV